MDIEATCELWRAYKDSEIIDVIHSDDEMYNGGPGHYWSVGRSAVQAILSSLALSWLPQVNRILDLPCGHGRVARHLRAAFPNAQLFYCDLHEGAGEYCARTFGGKNVPASEDLTRAQLPDNLDLIWVGSLFTHVDRERSFRWMQHLVDHLSSNGCLIATFHGHFSANVTDFGETIDQKKLKREFDAAGYGYAKYSNFEVDYGVSLSKPSAILDIADSLPMTKVVCYTERGWANNHDVLTLAKTDRLKPWD